GKTGIRGHAPARGTCAGLPAAVQSAGWAGRPGVANRACQALRVARRRRIDDATRGVPRVRAGPGGPIHLRGAGRLGEVLRPRTLAEALALRARHPDALPIAGGTDLMVEVNGGRRRPTRMLDLAALPELGHWERREGAVRLGAAVPYARVIAE